MSSDAGSTANPGYALGQLQRALAALVGHPDPAVRARAAAKADGWRAVLAGMRSGELVIGSRTPVRDTPAWVTLEVAHGGFATGRLSAEQPLDDDERARLADLPPLPGHSDRQRLNLWFLSDDGQALLLAALEQDRCVVELPEHAAIPTVVLLLARGHQEQALDLVAQLWPFVHRLRLTPRLVDAPQPLQPLVHVQPVGAVREQLQRTTTPLQVRAMQSTLSTWNPLHDELLALWAQTVDGDLPRRLRGRRRVAGRRWLALPALPGRLAGPPASAARPVRAGRRPGGHPDAAPAPPEQHASARRRPRGLPGRQHGAQPEGRRLDPPGAGGRSRCRW